MKEIFEYYLNACQQAIINATELSFEFSSDFFVVFSFDMKIDAEDEDFDSEYFSFNSVSSISEIEGLLEKINVFTNLTIRGGYEYLGLREHLTDYQSITNEMYLLIRRINSFQRGAILNYYTSVDYGDPMCDNEGIYGFHIEITKNLWWDIGFARFIIENKTNAVGVPNFYTLFFRKNQSIKDNKVIPILSTNTKVRRLGYFKILSLFLDENKKVPATSINKKFETFCAKYKELLEENEFNKGLIIQTKNGISAKPYIEIATDIDLLNKINNIFHVGKSFKVYQTLKNDYSSYSNIFELNYFDKLYFLECILKSDYFYFSNLLELIFVEEKTTYANIISMFHSKLIKCLEDYKKQNIFGDRKVLNGIDTVLNRIKKWEKAQVYLEHIVMPRLNWMLDFGIIEFGASDEYFLTESGLKLFKHFCIWNDINTNKIVSPNAFLNKFMIHLFDDCYNNSNVINPKDENLILEKIYKHIEISFHFFKSLAPNRVTASQAANYTKYKLYLEDKIKVGYEFILGKLSVNVQDKFLFKYQEQYQDGYIQLKK